MPKKPTTLAELIPDRRNANKHSALGSEKLEKGLRDYGTGRSILISNDNEIIAGNGVSEAAAAQDELEAVHKEEELVIKYISTIYNIHMPGKNSGYVSHYRETGQKEKLHGKENLRIPGHTNPGQD